jgi:hypothetical protein
MDRQVVQKLGYLVYNQENEVQASTEEKDLSLFMMSW